MRLMLSPIIRGTVLLSDADRVIVHYEMHLTTRVIYLWALRME